MTTLNPENKQPKLHNNELRRLRGIGHSLKPVVTIGNKGLTDSVLEEIERALTDHELIKVKVPSGSKTEREQFGAELADKTNAQVVHHIGRMILLLRRNAHADPRLSNLLRFS